MNDYNKLIQIAQREDVRITADEIQAIKSRLCDAGEQRQQCLIFSTSLTRSTKYTWKSRGVHLSTDDDY